MSTYTLKYPVESNGNQVDRVTIRGVQAQDLKESEDFAGNSFHGARWIVKHICELSDEAVKTMSVADFNEISRLILQESEILKQYSK